MSFECINEIPYGGDKIRVYRYNGGATMDYGIIVRKENSIVPGLMLTNQYLNEYHQDTIGIEIIDGNKLKLTNLRKNNELFKIVAL